MVYLLPILMILFGCYYYDYRQNQRGRLVLWITLLIIFIAIPTFRYRMGGDTLGYYAFYEKIHGISDLRLAEDIKSSRFGPGYIILNSLGKSVTSEFMLVQFFVALITNGAIFYFFWKNTRHCFMAVLIYAIMLYLNLNMEVMREALAVSIFLLSWPFYRDGKWLYYYLCCFLALMFHVSAIVLFLFPLFCLPGVRFLFTFGARTWIIGALILILGFAVSYFFFDLIRSIAFTENVMERAEVYSKKDIGGLKSLNIFGFFGIFIRYILYPSVAIYFLNLTRKGKFLKDEGTKKKEILSVASIYVSLASISIFILGRYNNYLFFFSIVMMSEWIFTHFKINERKWVRFGFVEWIAVILPLFILTFTSYYLRTESASNLKTYMLYYPYKDGFTKEMDPQREKLFKYTKDY